MKLNNYKLAILHFILCLTLISCYDTKKSDDHNASFLDNSCDITAFSFTITANPALTADITGSIVGTAITLEVPAGRDITALKATFTTTGKSVMIGTISQVSGVTPNSFASSVTYTVTAENNTQKNYTATVTQKTKMAWKNATSGNVRDIAWINQNGSQDATWPGDTIVLVTTNANEISALIGHGECLVPGDSYSSVHMITVQGESSTTFTIPKGSSNVYVIQSTAKK
jgi:hypothetical protein